MKKANIHDTPASKAAPGKLDEFLQNILLLNNLFAFSTHPNKEWETSRPWRRSIVVRADRRAWS
jgi:hypothetical protein